MAETVPTFGPAVAAEVRKLLSSVGMETTPLLSMTEEASAWGLGGVYVKDEGKRLNVESFKPVGGCYAIAKLMCQQLGVQVADVDIPKLKALYTEKFGQTLFVTATDGNHGRGIAWAAGIFGQKAKVYMPKGTVEARIEHVRALGGEVIVTEVNYDRTVEMATEFAKTSNLQLIQDTAWEGYTEIPTAIMQGYCCMADEILDQLGTQKPTHVFLQCGVGSMAGAVADFYMKALSDDPPIIVCFEPKNAACIYESAKAGELKEVDGELESMMAGLCCGVPSIIGWPILRDCATAYLWMDDVFAGNGMRMLKKRGMVAGECGGAGPGLLQYICTSTDDVAKELRKELKLSSTSHVVTINTEGATDPVNYKLEIEKPDGTGTCGFVLGKPMHLEPPAKRQCM